MALVSRSDEILPRYWLYLAKRTQMNLICLKTSDRAESWYLWDFGHAKNACKYFQYIRASGSFARSFPHASRVTSFGVPTAHGCTSTIVGGPGMPGARAP